MHPVIKAQLKEFSYKHSDESLTQSAFFEVFSIHAIDNGLMGHSIDPFKAHLEETEFGIDGISIILQGELCTDDDQAETILSVGTNHSAEFHFFQSKTSENSDYGDVAKFLDAVIDFFGDGKLAKSIQVEELRSCKDQIYSTPTNKNPSIRCFYCTTGAGTISEPIQTLIDTNIRRMEEMSLFSSIDISIQGARPLQDGYRSATNTISGTFDFPGAITLPSHPSVDEAFIGVVSANELLKLAIIPGEAQDDDRVNRAVFYDNIRDFNPESEINRAILTELNEGGEESFVFKNNGVTVVAKDISRKGNTYKLEDYQIVNGCQTTNILFMARDLIQDVNVPLRLIGSKDTDFVSTIIIGTNKQNEVKDDQFWALLPFMKDLEEYCRSQPGDKKILIERRENQYRNVEAERTRIFKPAELIKAITATYLGQPNRAARDYRSVRKELRDQIFQPNHNVELYHMAAMCSYKFDFAIRNRRVDRSRNIYKFYALFAAFRDAWNGDNLLNQPRKRQGQVVKKVTSLLDNEERWIKHIEKVSAVLDSRIKKQKLKTREQARDYIRTDSAVTAFIHDAYPPK